jgi:ADP-ribosylglycohydrolase
MDKIYVQQHILGSLAAALIGDSMGCATETMTPERTLQQFGGKVSGFQDPPEGTFAAGRKQGQLTDDSTQMLEMAYAIIECDGVLTPEAVVKHLLHWADDAEMFGRFTGPSTRKAINLLREGKSPYETGRFTLGGLISNGAAMKVAPLGLAHPGDLDSAIRDATIMCIPTHNTDVAYAGAAAIAAGIAAALVPGANQLSVVDACLYGIRQGYKIGKEKAQVIAHPSMEERARIAIEIAIAEPEFDTACSRLAAIIGCGLPIMEAVPVSIGLFVAARGDPNQTILGAVNMGDDSDTVATIAGAISGAFAGIERLNSDWYRTIEEVNELQLAPIAEKLAHLPSSG